MKKNPFLCITTAGTDSGHRSAITVLVMDFPDLLKEALSRGPDFPQTKGAEAKEEVSLKEQTLICSYAKPLRMLLMNPKQNLTPLTALICTKI